MMKVKNKFYRKSAKCIFGIMFAAFIAQGAWAFEPFVVKDMRVEGLQRIEPGTVFATLPVHVGDTYNDEKASESIKALYALGLFKNIQIKVDGQVLVIDVQERPNINNVSVTGAKEFDDKTLKKVLAEIGLAEGRPFEQALLDNAEQELKRQYANKGMYSTQVIASVSPISKNRVDVSIDVKEYGTAKIDSVRIVGNNAFSESNLLDLFNLNTGTWLSWYTKSNQYARSKLNADLETLRSYYLSRGYLEFKIDSTQVAISPDKRRISITVNIHEGPRYVVSKVALSGDFLGKDKEFQSLVTIQAGKAYNADEVTSTVRDLNQYYGDFGYAFSNVDVQTKVDKTNDQVAIILVGTPGRRVYVRRVNVVGNNRTRDVVIRREFRQFAGAWFDGAKIRQSRDRVDRLGFFTNVSVDMQPVANRPDQVDLQVTVKERPTGSVSAGASISSSDGLGFMFGYQETNAFGSGNGLALQVNTSKVNRQIMLSMTDPYFTQYGVSRTIDIYQNTSSPYVDLNSYSISKTGAKVNYGIPISENDTIFAGIGVYQTRIQPGNLLPPAFTDFINKNGYTNNALPLSLGWGRNTLDSMLAPTSGKLMRVNSSWSIAGQLRYLKLTGSYTQYIPLTRKLTFSFGSNLGLGYGMGGGDFPILENFFEGGLGSIRGFSQSSLRTASQRKANVLTTGAPRIVDFSTQLLAPLPGAGTDPTLRWFAFADAGGIYDANEPITLDSLRASVGVGLSWISPVGPLSLAFAKPVRYFPGDNLQYLQFQIGQTF